LIKGQFIRSLVGMAARLVLGTLKTLQRLPSRMWWVSALAANRSSSVAVGGAKRSFCSTTDGLPTISQMEAERTTWHGEWIAKRPAEWEAQRADMEAEWEAQRKVMEAEWEAQQAVWESEPFVS
jgi:hypothetical protein